MRLPHLNPIRLASRIELSDVLAGVAVAFVLIPQSLAYAELAGLPPHVGLYAAMLPPIAAALFASSPYLQTGPVAMTSLLTFGALAGLAAPGTSQYVALAALLALVVGAMRVALGLIRVGWVAFLMSHPVLTGFTAAAAILICASQLPTALGAVTPDGGLLERAGWALVHPSSWDGASVVLSVVTLLLVLAGRRVHTLFPGVLVALLVGLMFSFVSGYGGPVVGEVPQGLPPFSLELPWSALPGLLFPAAVIALIGFAEAAAISRTFAAEDRTAWNPNREFVSQGVANLASGISGGFPVGGSFSRSSVNRAAGGKTRLSGAVTGLIVLAFLPVAGVLSALPAAVLGAIVIAAVVRLIDLNTMVSFVRHSYPQTAIAWVTFVLTLALAPHIERAVLIGIGFAIAVHIWRELPVLVRSSYQDGALRIEPQGVLFFASAPALSEALLTELGRHPEADRLVIDLSRLGRIDYTGALALKDVMADARAAQLAVEFEEVPPQATRILLKVLGPEAVHATKGG